MPRWPSEWSVRIRTPQLLTQQKTVPAGCFPKATPQHPHLQLSTCYVTGTEYSNEQDDPTEDEYVGCMALQCQRISVP